MVAIIREFAILDVCVCVVGGCDKGVRGVAVLVDVSRGGWLGLSLVLVTSELLNISCLDSILI